MNMTLPYASRPYLHLRQLIATIGLVLLANAVDGVGALSESQAEENGEYLGPCALVASKDGTTLYVANADAHQLAWVDLATGKVTRQIAVPDEPTGLALSPDGTKLFVTCAAPKSTVAVLATDSGELTTPLPAGHTAMSPVISPDGKRLYVCNRFDNDISVIDLPNGRELSRVPAVREPIAADITPDGRFLVVANHLPNTRTDKAYHGDVSPIVTLVDTQTCQTTSIPLRHGANGLRGVCVLPDGKYALVTHLLSNFQEVPVRVDSGWINVNVVSLVDLARRMPVGVIGLDESFEGSANPWDVRCSADGKSVYVTASGTHQLCMIDTETLLGDTVRRTMQPVMGAWPIYPTLGASLWRHVLLPDKGPRGLAVVGSKIIVASYFSDSLAVVEPSGTETPKVSSIPLGPVPQMAEARRGQFLFCDASICYQRWQSCASCHPDGRIDGMNWDLMNDGMGNPKNTKSMLLAHETPPAMAEGVRMSAEEAVRSGFEHILFVPRPEADTAAVDTYLKSLRPVPSPHLVDGRLSPAAQRGQELFQSHRVGCSRCHPAPLYTDRRSHNVGSRTPDEKTDRFDTPTLVEVWRTAPYLHDGRYTTVKELLVEGEHGLLGHVEDLSDQELDYLVEFVLSL